MKNALLKHLATLLLLCLPLALEAQGDLYTKSARLADFPQKSTKIVLSGQAVTDAVLREEITSRWRISPYEFCTTEEFDELRGSQRFYFLHIESDDEFTWLHLTKGGPTTGNPLRTAMEVVSVPIASADDINADELVFLPAFIDIIQEYLLQAIVSDKVSYRGLRGIVSKDKKGKHVCNDAQQGRELFLSGAPNTIVPVVVWGTPVGKHRHYWRMRISTDQHLLYEYKRKKVRL